MKIEIVISNNGISIIDTRPGKSLQRSYWKISQSSIARMLYLVGENPFHFGSFSTPDGEIGAIFWIHF